MKHNDQNKPRKKAFIKIPSYPGGKEAYQKFIKENIVYPQEAFSNKVEGYVHVVYSVNNIGEIMDVEVTKGIGFGCDEEAIRVIRMMKYEPARNRGVKMKVEMKTRIQFKLPETVHQENQSGVQLIYTSTSPEKSNSPEPKSQAVYNYIINLGSG